MSLTPLFLSVSDSFTSCSARTSRGDAILKRDPAFQPRSWLTRKTLGGGHGAGMLSLSKRTLIHIHS